MRIADSDRKCDILKTVVVFLLDVWLCICSHCWIGTLAEVMMVEKTRIQLPLLTRQEGHVVMTYHKCVVGSLFSENED